MTARHLRGTGKLISGLLILASAACDTQRGFEAIQLGNGDLTVQRAGARLEALDVARQGAETLAQTRGLRASRDQHHLQALTQQIMASPLSNDLVAIDAIVVDNTSREGANANGAAEIMVLAILRGQGGAQNVFRSGALNLNQFRTGGTSVVLTPQNNQSSEGDLGYRFTARCTAFCQNMNLVMEKTDSQPVVATTVSFQRASSRLGTLRLIGDVRSANNQVLSVSNYYRTHGGFQTLPLARGQGNDNQKILGLSAHVDPIQVRDATRLAELKVRFMFKDGETNRDLLIDHVIPWGTLLYNEIKTIDIAEALEGGHRSVAGKARIQFLEGGRFLLVEIKIGSYEATFDFSVEGSNSSNLELRTSSLGADYKTYEQALRDAGNAAAAAATPQAAPATEPTAEAVQAPAAAQAPVGGAPSNSEDRNERGDY